MHEQLTQKRRFSSSTLIIEHTGVRVTDQGINKRLTYFIRFENISSSTFFARIFSKDAIMISIVIGVVVFFLILNQLAGKLPQPLGLLLTIACLIIILVLLWFTRREIVGLGIPGSGLSVDANHPSKEGVEQFLHALQQAKQQYLRETYFDTIIEPASRDEVQRLLWLRDEGAISQQEFLSAMRAAHPSTSETSLGFHKKPLT